MVVSARMVRVGVPGWVARVVAVSCLAACFLTGCKSTGRPDIPALDPAKKKELAEAVETIRGVESGPQLRSMMSVTALVELEAARLRSSYLDVFRAATVPDPARRADAMGRAVEAAIPDLERDLKRPCPGLEWRAFAGTSAGSVAELLVTSCPTLCTTAIRCADTMADVPAMVELIVIGAYAYLDNAGPPDPMETSLLNGILTGEL